MANVQRLRPSIVALPTVVIRHHMPPEYQDNVLSSVVVPTHASARDMVVSLATSNRRTQAFIFCTWAPDVGVCLGEARVSQSAYSEHRCVVRRIPLCGKEVSAGAVFGAVTSAVRREVRSTSSAANLATGITLFLVTRCLCVIVHQFTLTHSAAGTECCPHGSALWSYLPTVVGTSVWLSSMGGGLPTDATVSVVACTVTSTGPHAPAAGAAVSIVLSSLANEATILVGGVVTWAEDTTSVPAPVVLSWAVKSLPFRITSASGGTTYQRCEPSILLARASGHCFHVFALLNSESDWAWIARMEGAMNSLNARVLKWLPEIQAVICRHDDHGWRLMRLHAADEGSTCMKDLCSGLHDVCSVVVLGDSFEPRRSVVVILAVGERPDGCPSTSLYLCEVPGRRMDALACRAEEVPCVMKHHHPQWPLECNPSPGRGGGVLCALAQVHPQTTSARLGSVAVVVWD